MTYAYLLLHENPKTEDVKCIGVYSSKAAAEAAVRRIISRPGFRDSPEGFAIDPYEIDKDHWTEGFGIG